MKAIKMMSVFAIFTFGALVFGGFTAFAADIPSAAATGASSIGQTSASLGGSINPMGLSTEYWVEYGTNNEFSYSTIRYSAGDGTYSTDISQTITGLSTGTTYQYRIVARNSLGSIVSNIKSFTTANGASGTIPISDIPSVAATGAFSIGQTSASLGGSINPMGLSTEYWVEYGTGNSFQYRSNTFSAGSDRNSLSVSVSLYDLSRGTTYEYRIAAKNSAGSIVSNIKSFTTSQPESPIPTGSAPVVRANSARDIARDSAVLSGSINPNGAWTEYWFEYGTGNNFDYKTQKWSLNGSNDDISVSASVYGLSHNTTYNYRLAASNSHGMNVSSSLSFTTIRTSEGRYYGPLSVISVSATEISSYYAVLNADVNPNGYSAEVWFEYGYLGQGLNRTSRSQTVGGGNYYNRVSIQVSDLSPGTSYEFRAVARNASETVRGSIFSFSTFQNRESGYYYGSPQATTVGSSAVLQNVALLKGRANPNGSTTSVWFEYGVSASNLNLKSAEQIAGNDTVTRDYFFGLTGLSANTVYYYRAVASNAFGTSRGDVMSFKTLNFWTSAAITTDAAVAKTVIKEYFATDNDSGVMLDPSVSRTNPSAGDTIDYVLTYRNASKGKISGCSIKVILPLETEYLDSNVKPTSQTGNNLVFYVGDIGKGNQSAITIKVKVDEDAKRGSSLLFNSFLEYDDYAGKFQTVDSYIAVNVKDGKSAGFLANLSGLAESLSGSWLFLILLLLILITLIYLVATRKKEDNFSS